MAWHVLKPNTNLDMEPLILKCHHDERTGEQVCEVALLGVSEAGAAGAWYQMGRGSECHACGSLRSVWLP